MTVSDSTRLTADKLQQLGEAAVTAVQKSDSSSKDWDTVSASAYESLNCVTKGAFTEVKSFKNPPAEVADVCAALAIVFGCKEKAIDWAKARKLTLADAKFLSKVKEFDPKSIDADMVKRLNPIVSKEFFTVESIMRKSVAAAALCEWVPAVYEFGSA